jgi:SAM-dependent methyltransferase
LATTPPLSVHAWLRYDAVRRLLASSDARTVLEIGVGLGSVGVLLAKRFDYTGIDLDERSITSARDKFARHGLDPGCLLQGGLEVVHGRVFDLVCAFEVLEHFEDENATVAEWRPFVAPGGAILVSMPAGPARFGKADEKAGHFRRYTRRDAERVLTQGGFTQVRVLNYGVPAGYVLEAARNVLARRQLRRQLTPGERTLASGRWLQPPAALARLTRAVAAPLAVAQRPFMHEDKGTGLVAMGFLDPSPR